MLTTGQTESLPKEIVQKTQTLDSCDEHVSLSFQDTVAGRKRMKFRIYS